MTVDPYKIIPRGGNQFDFESEGEHGFIRKRVEFNRLKPDEFNVGFGDLDAEGTLDDLKESNNGDLLKVFATIIKVMEDFLEIYPKASLLFTGSTQQRTRIYSMILKRYFPRFSRKYEITVLNNMSALNFELPYDPEKEIPVATFRIRKKVKDEQES
ncbi:DUF6934 family protein [Chitinophaga caseinilytica]|uniref:Uncharacterized protein n=1 Tax=Chitinophaga caseinilytica TaxID=2267521 RepID=A0ABZ2Z575_9BACT